MKGDLNLMLGALDEVYALDKAKRDAKEKLKKEEYAKRVTELRNSGLYHSVLDIEDLNLHMDAEQFIQYLIAERKHISQLQGNKAVKILGLFNGVELEVTQRSTVEDLFVKYDIGIKKWAAEWIKEK